MADYKDRGENILSSFEKYTKREEELNPGNKDNAIVGKCVATSLFFRGLVSEKTLGISEETIRIHQSDKDSQPGEVIAKNIMLRSAKKIFDMTVDYWLPNLIPSTRMIIKLKEGSSYIYEGYMVAINYDQIAYAFDNHILANGMTGVQQTSNFCRKEFVPKFKLTKDLFKPYVHQIENEIALQFESTKNLFKSYGQIVESDQSDYLVFNEQTKTLK